MSQLDTANALIVVDEGGANEVKIELWGRDVALLEADVSLTVSANAQRLSAKVLDQRGNAWRKLVFGRDVKVYLQSTVVFTGVMVMPRYDVMGTGVLVEFDAVGRTQVLYSKKVAADHTYENMDTGAIAKDVIDDHFTGTLTTTNVVTTTGIPVTEFTVTAGENVGSVLERLTRYDGYSFYVDTNDDVHYYEVSASSQATIYEEDLLGDAGEHFVEYGVTPPKNVVRVRGGSGYLSKTKQDSRDSYYNLDSTAKYVAQRFQATESRLSGVQLYCDRTTGTNVPGTMTFGVYKDAHNEAPAATLTLSSTDGGSTTNGGMAEPKDENDGTYHEYTTGGAGVVRYNFDLGSAKTLYGWGIRFQESHGFTYALYYSDDAVSYTVADSGFTNVSALTQDYNRWIASSSHRYWRVLISGLPASSFVLKTYELRLWCDNQAGANAHVPAYDSTGLYKIEWSDDISFAAGTVATAPNWTVAQAYDASHETEAQRKLQLTDNAYYWAVWKASSDASGSKYWRVGYYAASSAYADGEAKVTTDSGQTWSALNYDLTFRLLYLNGEVDLTDSDSASITAYGEWYHEEVLPELTTNEEAQYVATQLLDRFAAPGKRMTLPLKRVRPELTPKQVITVVRPLLDINETEDIVEIRHTIRPHRANTVIVTGVLPYNGARAVEELRKRD